MAFYNHILFRYGTDMETLVDRLTNDRTRVVFIICKSFSDYLCCWVTLYDFLRSGDCPSDYSAATRPRASCGLQPYVEPLGTRWCLSTCG